LKYLDFIKSVVAIDNPITILISTRIIEIRVEVTVMIALSLS